MLADAKNNVTMAFPHFTKPVVARHCNAASNNAKYRW